MVTRYRVCYNPDGSVRLEANPAATTSRPLHPWLGRLVHLYSGFDTLGGYVNIHVPAPEFLRVVGYALAIIYLPFGWCLTWYWLRAERWPRWEWHKRGNSKTW